MGYDPNDPNQGSQAPAPDGGVPSGGLSLDALVKSRPEVARWLAAHNQGRDLPDAAKGELFRIIKANGIDPTMLEIDDNGNFNAGTGHALRDIALGSLMAFGPVVAAWAIPAIASVGGGGAATGAATTAGETSPWLADGTFAGASTVSGAASAAGAVGVGADGAASAAEETSPWLADGTFVGDSTVSGAAPAGGGVGALVDKYGYSAISSGIKGYLGQKNENAQLEAQQRGRDQATALTESQLDPFRGYMKQAGDVGKLDMMAEGNFSSSPVQADAKYGRGLNVQPEQFYNPSAIMRATARGNRDAVAAGKTVPTMTDPANYGKMPVGQYSAAPTTPAPTAGTDPSNSPATALLAALRAKGLVTDDNQTSPWLAV